MSKYTSSLNYYEINLHLDEQHVEVHTSGPLFPERYQYLGMIFACFIVVAIEEIILIFIRDHLSWLALNGFFLFFIMVGFVAAYYGLILPPEIFSEKFHTEKSGLIVDLEENVILTSNPQVNEIPFESLTYRMVGTKPEFLDNSTDYKIIPITKKVKSKYSFTDVPSKYRNHYKNYFPVFVVDDEFFINLIPFYIYKTHKPDPWYALQGGNVFDSNSFNKIKRYHERFKRDDFEIYLINDKYYFVK